MDPFETLGIAPRFAFDLATVEQRHRELSRALHPDRYAGRPSSERRLALGKAIEVNEAMRLVRDPIKRAEALIRRSGVALTETSEPTSSKELLMEMMDAREELATAQAKRDLEQLRRVGAAMSERAATTMQALGERLDGANGSADRLREALPLLGELRYVRRFLDEVAAIEEDLEGL
jgi:molecular chaperone HscB